MQSFLQSHLPIALRRVLPAICFLAVSSVCASASPITFTGEDLNAGPGSAHPNSMAAAVSFNAAASALGTVSTISFENAPVGSFSSLGVAPGVTLTGAAYSGANQSINNTPNLPGDPSLDGFNTTPGGSNYAEMLGGSLTFSFSSPTQFFGAYLSGVQTYFYQDVFTFSDGTSQSIDAPGAGTSSGTGALDFVGFTDAGKSISSVTIYAGSASTGADFIGVDDVQYQGTPVVATTPEPGSLVLVLSGVASLGAGYYRRLRKVRS